MGQKQMHFHLLSKLSNAFLAVIGNKHFYIWECAIFDPCNRTRANSIGICVILA